MGTLLTICVIVAVVGLILIILSVIPGADFIPGGYRPGVALLVIGILLYVILTLVVHPATAS